MNEKMTSDEQALLLREQGRTFQAIAQILDLDSARAAQAAFLRSLRLRPRIEQAWLRSRELGRLDALASRMRGRDDLSVAEVVRRLRGLERQRETILSIEVSALRI